MLIYSIMQFFLDESGECSFSANSHHKHFLITILSISPSEQNNLKNTIKRHNAKMIKSGWDKTKEIKASNLLFRYKTIGDNAICTLLTNLSRIISLKINYFIVNKDGITSTSFRNASYGIGYNYFTKVLLSKLIFDDGFHDVHLIYDKRNKETHLNKHFREYLTTEILGTALENNTHIRFSIMGEYSHQCYGLLAVDYFCWAIYRKFENGCAKYFNLFTNKVNRKIEWFV